MLSHRAHGGADFGNRWKNGVDYVDAAFVKWPHGNCLPGKGVDSQSSREKRAVSRAGNMFCVHSCDFLNAVYVAFDVFDPNPNPGPL